MAKTNAQIAAEFFERVWNEGDESSIDRLTAADATLHGLPDKTGGPFVGPAGFKPFVRAFRGAIPDIRIVPVRFVSEGDLVATHCKVTGTHTGPQLGVPASHKPIDFEGVALARFKDGKVQEAWNFFDFLTMYQQIEQKAPLTPTW